jgi:protease I
MDLEGKFVVVLSEENYEDLELWYPYYRLKEAGADVKIVGMPGIESYVSKHGLPVKPEITPGDVDPKKVDILVVPGGYAPDKMRRHPEMLDLVRKVFENNKIVAMICHAGWVPISAGIVKGKRVTSVNAIKDDLVNAGAYWEDDEVVIDSNLISSRRPEDLPAFCRAIIRIASEQGK